MPKAVTTRPSKRSGRSPTTIALAAQAHYMAGRIERAHHRIRLAELQYLAALKLDPRLIAAHRELIYIYGMQLRRRELDAEFKALQGLTQLTHHDLFIWGLTHFTIWGPKSADELETFIAADPLDRHSRLALATMLLEHPAMESRVEEILQPLPAADAEAAALRIEMKLNQGRIDEALALLKDTSGADPHLARLRGRVALLKGDLPAAIRFFQEALSEAPFDRVSLSELGKALLDQRRQGRRQRVHGPRQTIGRGVQAGQPRQQAQPRERRRVISSSLAGPAQPPACATRPAAGTRSRSAATRSTPKPSRRSPDCASRSGFGLTSQYQARQAEA